MSTALLVCALMAVIMLLLSLRTCGVTELSAHAMLTDLPQGLAQVDSASEAADGLFAMSVVSPIGMTTLIKLYVCYSLNSLQGVM